MLTAEPTREQRIVSFHDLCKCMSRDVGHWSLDHDDLVQTATVAAIEAIDSFEPSRNLTLEQWVAQSIRWKLRMLVRTASRATRNREDCDLSTLTSN
jgi:DNA-directed RNA polymerase specialized sigma subunit